MLVAPVPALRRHRLPRLLLGRRLYNERTGVIAGILVAFHPLLLRYVPSLHLETLLTFLVTLMVWCTVRFYYDRSVLNGALVGLVAGLATLTKAVVLLYPLVFAVALLLVIRAARRRGESQRSPWKGFVVMFLVLAATIAPWTIRNYGTTGHFVLVSSGTSDAFLPRADLQPPRVRHAAGPAVHDRREREQRVLPPARRGGGHGVGARRLRDRPDPQRGGQAGRP